MATIIDHLKENNEFPVVFIGAGISKRYLESFPDWTRLLEEFWDQVGLDNFYGTFNNIRDDISRANLNFTDKEVDHYSNIKMGSILEEQYNQAFNAGKVKLDFFSQKDAFRSKISPFKKAISERFKRYSLKPLMEHEYESFQKMLLKTQIILTTNYDPFIENSYNIKSNYKITKYIGQKGFFNTTYGYAELYKIHGCVESPSDIVITEGDYDRFEKNSVLISAKIISMMMHSPIIFMGYSLTDINVRKIIKDFTRSLNEEEILLLENRLVLIEWAQGEEGFVEEVINDRDLGCKLKVIKTDNYEKLFSLISTINQGIAPTEVRKYQHVIKELIIDRGKKGALNSVLLSPEQLDLLEDNLLTKNITVALGDAKYIFQIPDVITYSLDYISDKEEISTEIQMRLAVGQNGTARFPINKFLDEELIRSSSLHAMEKEKLLGKIKNFSDFEKNFNSIISSSIVLRHASKLTDITSLKVVKSKIYETIAFNIKRLDLEEVKSFLISELETLKETGEIYLGTSLRRLLLIYDILKNGKNKGGNA
ncbi:SIR2 family protein [Paenibacillus humicus]|uniref:SIR2 family protein n=1 Tax=Paenibacillus humicus TaxID=412861 RepID=UPI003F184378